MKLKNLLLFGLIFLLIMGCGKKEDEVIKIGSILPLTDDAAVYGKNLKDGMDLALEIFNSERVEEKKVEIIYEDSKADPKLAVNSFEKLTTVEMCKMILGGFSSSEVLSIAPIAERRKIVLISPTASAPSITEAGDFIFRTTPSDNFDGNIMAKFAYENLNIRKVAILYLNNSYGKGIFRVFKDNFGKLGGEVVVEMSFESGGRDFRTQLLAIKNSHAEGLYLIAGAELGNILKQKIELSIDIKTFTVGLVENPKIVEVAGRGAEEVYYSYPSFQVDSPDSIVHNFIEKFQTRYNKHPDVLNAYGFDLVNIALMAIIGNEDSSEKIKNELYKISDYNGVTGLTTFNKYGDVTKTAGIKVIRGGKFNWFIKKFN